MKRLAIEKNLFELLEEKGMDAHKAASRLNLSIMTMSVYDYMERFERGGLRHKYFVSIEEICEAWCAEQAEVQVA